MGVSVQTGTQAAFAVQDVICPTACDVLRAAGPELAIQGRIMYLSDCGERREHFAIIDVQGIHTPLIVPVDRLRLCEPDNREATASQRLAASGS